MHRLLASLAFAVGCVLTAAASTAVPHNIDFKVYRDGDEIGHHRVNFTQQGEDLIADVSIELAVSFAGIRVFHYVHASREVWRDGALQSIRSTTKDDGDALMLNLDRQENGLRIEGTKFTGEAPATLIPTSYWRPETPLQTQIIDSQNGRVFPVVIEKVGRETIEAGGKTIEANRYTLTEQLVMNLWYDDQGNWVKTSFDARGSTIDYVLQPPVHKEAHLP